MLGTTTQHALRALTVLASLPRGTWVLVRELAQATRTPVNYLGKIMVLLAHAGIVEGKRGAGGGYRLAHPPEAIPLAEVVQALEGRNQLPTCLLAGFRQCSDDNGCPAHSHFKKVREVWQEFLEKTTLATIASGFTAKLEAHRLIWGEERVHGKE
jgi:Rrf2 family protein